MLQIKEYDLSNLDKYLNNQIKEIDDKIKEDLIKISSIKVLKFFFEQLNNIVDIKSDFSFIKASVSNIEYLKKIDTSLKICHLNVFNQKFKSLATYLKSKKKYKNCTLNDILEFIFGYHIEVRTQVLKRFVKSTNFDNCVYCLNVI